MEDALFNLIAISYNPKYYISNKPIYFYNINEQSTSNVNTELTDKALNLIDQYVCFLDDRGIFQESYDMLSPLIGRVFCWTIFKEMSQSQKSFKELVGEIKRFMDHPSIARGIKNKEVYSELHNIPILQNILYTFCFFAGRHKFYRLIGYLFALSYPFFKIYIIVFVRR